MIVVPAERQPSPAPHTDTDLPKDLCLKRSLVQVPTIPLDVVPETPAQPSVTQETH